MKLPLPSFFFTAALLIIAVTLEADTPPERKIQQEKVKQARKNKQPEKAASMEKRQVKAQRAGGDDKPPRADQPTRQAVQQIRRAPEAAPNLNKQKSSEKKDSKKADRQKTPEFTPRSPSMSRSKNPTQSNRHPSDAKPSREAFKQQAQQFSEKRKPQLVNTQEADEVRSRFYKRRERDKGASHKVSRDVHRHHPHYRNWFGNHFFQERGGYPTYWRNDNVNWWRGARWPQVHLWLGWPTAYPVYYSYGYPVQVTVDPSLSDESSASLPSRETGEWMPLGVFAIGPDVDQAANANIFLQLAINRQGDLAGTYYNSSTNQSYPVEGTVDSESQQVYWRQANEITAPVITTGLYNLTQEVADIQLTFPNGVIQNWTLVRVLEQ